jgi:hypothetical protein
MGENPVDQDYVIHRIIEMGRQQFHVASNCWKPKLTELFKRSTSDFEKFATAALNLMTNPWSSRVWIIQEVALASQMPIILAGAA